MARVVASKAKVSDEEVDEEVARRWLEGDYGDMTWRAMPASIEALREIRDNRSMRVLYWEGYGGEDRGVNVYGIAVPGMLVDMQTANAVVTVWDALNDKNKEMAAEAIGRSPGKFVQMVEFCWSQVRPK